MTAAQKEAILFSLAMGLLFFGFHPIDKNALAYFSGQGMRLTAYALLLLGYIGLLIGGIIAPLLISRLGTRLCCQLGGLGYLFLTLSIPTGDLWFMGPAVLWAGLGAMPMWVSMSRNILTTAREGEATSAIGTVMVGYGLGSAAGLIAFSLMGQVWGPRSAFEHLPYITCLGLLPYFFIREVREAEKPDFGQVLRVYANRKTLKVCTLSLTTYTVFGLLATQIPLQISQAFGGLEYVGLTAVAYIVLVICLAALARWGKIPAKLLLTAFYLVILGLLAVAAYSVLKMGVWLLLVGTTLACIGVAVLFAMNFITTEYAPPQKQLVLQSALMMSDSVAILLVVGISLSLHQLGWNGNWVYLAGLMVSIVALVFWTPLLSNDYEGLKNELKH